MIVYTKRRRQQRQQNVGFLAGTLFSLFCSSWAHGWYTHGKWEHSHWVCGKVAGEFTSLLAVFAWGMSKIECAQNVDGFAWRTEQKTLILVVVHRNENKNPVLASRQDSLLIRASTREAHKKSRWVFHPPRRSVGCRLFSLWCFTFPIFLLRWCTLWKLLCNVSGGRLVSIIGSHECSSLTQTCTNTASHATSTPSGRAPPSLIPPISLSLLKIFSLSLLPLLAVRERRAHERKNRKTWTFLSKKYTERERADRSGGMR